MISDYLCANCNTIFEYKKPYGENFPENPKCPLCEETNTKRKIGVTIIVPEHMRSVNSGK